MVEFDEGVEAVLAVGVGLLLVEDLVGCGQAVGVGEGGPLEG